MGWTLQYRARSRDVDLEAFVKDANDTKPALSLGCEPYQWEVYSDGSVGGFTKVQSSWRSKRDFRKLIEELKALAERWPGVRIDAADDYVLCDWWHVKNINLEELTL